MGLFTWVEIDDSLLPEEYRGMKGWQTKQVVDPWMQTLKITKDGELLYEEYTGGKWVSDERALLGGYLEHDGKASVALDYHGDMEFHNSIVVNTRVVAFISLIARFTHGKLEEIFVGQVEKFERQE